MYTTCLVKKLAGRDSNSELSEFQNGSTCTCIYIPYIYIYIYIYINIYDRHLSELNIINTFQL